MKSTAKQENKFNFKRNIYIPKMSVDPFPVGSTTVTVLFSLIALNTNSFAAVENISMRFCVIQAHR